MKLEPTLRWAGSCGESTGCIHVETIPASRRTRGELGVLPCWRWMRRRWWNPFPALSAPLEVAGAGLEDGGWKPFAGVCDDDVVWRGRTLRVGWKCEMKEGVSLFALFVALLHLFCSCLWGASITDSTVPYHFLLPPPGQREPGSPGQTELVLASVTRKPTSLPTWAVPSRWLLVRHSTNHCKHREAATGRAHCLVYTSTKVTKLSYVTAAIYVKVIDHSILPVCQQRLESSLLISPF